MKFLLTFNINSIKIKNIETLNFKCTMFFQIILNQKVKNLINYFQKINKNNQQNMFLIL